MIDPIYRHAKKMTRGLGIAILLNFFFLWGTVGALETDAIGILEAFLRLIFIAPTLFVMVHALNDYEDIRSQYEDDALIDLATAPRGGAL